MELCCFATQIRRGKRFNQRFPMIEFSQGHSVSWLELMQSYQQYRTAIYNWSKEENAVKYKDISMELVPVFSQDRNLHRRLLVTDFLQSTDMWDENAISLVWRELTQVALKEQEEVAAWADMALQKLKNHPTILCVADEIFHLDENELKKEEPDFLVFSNGCILLWRLKCKDIFSRFCQRYKEQIFIASGFDEKDLEDMKNSI